MNKIQGYGFSVIGPSHVRNNMPNQDSFLIRKKNNFSLAVISDGLGSKKYSQRGSTAVCRSVYKAVQKLINHKKKKGLHKIELLTKIKTNWVQLISPYKPSDCSATCLFVLVTKSKCVVAMLGDGMIYLQGKEDKNSILLMDDKDESFSNSTFSLSDTNYLKEWQIHVFETQNIQKVLITSDGISSDLADGQEKLFCDDLLDDIKKQKYSAKKKEYLKSMMDNWPVPMHSDDKTCVIMELV
ncbi:MAG: PP2C family serine/threonine-protein phosphatase [Treponemataceae bacterium]